MYFRIFKKIKNMYKSKFKRCVLFRTQVRPLPVAEARDVHPANTPLKILKMLRILIHSKNIVSVIFI